MAGPPPKARAVVNPNRLDDTSGQGHLTAAGVVLVALAAVNREARKRGSIGSNNLPDLIQMLDLAAIGTVCDVAPLTGFNRAIVAQGSENPAQRQEYRHGRACGKRRAQGPGHRLRFWLYPWAAHQCGWPRRRRVAGDAAALNRRRRRSARTRRYARSAEPRAPRARSGDAGRRGDRSACGSGEAHRRHRRLALAGIRA